MERQCSKNIMARNMIVNAKKSLAIGDIGKVEEYFKAGLAFACTSTCYDPGAIFLVNIHLIDIYLRQKRNMEVLIMIQQALYIFNSVFFDGSLDAEISSSVDQVIKIVQMLKILQHDITNNTKSSPGSECESITTTANKRVYTKLEMIAIKNANRDVRNR